MIARYFGARDICSLQKAIHTTIAFGLICGCLLTLVGVFAAPQILVWMGTPSAVLPNSITYFRIYFCGSLAFVMYNIFVGILQSVGDSRHPLIYLVISSAINITLDLFFIGVLHYGVGGAALATVISQFISVSLCLRQLLRSPEEFRISFRKIHLEKNMLQRILTNGLPAGFQNSIISVANVFVQANITRRCRVLGSCRLPASPWRLPPSSARTLGPENMTAPRRAQLSASSVQLLVRR